MQERVLRKRNLLTLLVGMKTGTATMGNIWRLLKKLKIELLSNSTILLLGIIEISLSVKNVGTHVHCNIILSSQDVET